MASERNVQFSAPTWLRDLGFSSWLLVGFVLIIVGLIWLLAETSTIVMPVILAAVLGAVAGPGGRLAGAPQGSAHRRRDPRPARACRHRRAHLLPRLRRHLRPVGRHLGEDERGAGQDPGLVGRRRRGQRAERQGGRAGGRARDPHDAAERRRGGHRAASSRWCSSSPSRRSARCSCSRTGRSCIASSTGTWACPSRSPTSSRPTSPSRCAATSSP